LVKKPNRKAVVTFSFYGVSFGDFSYCDPDFTDDICLLAKLLLDLLVPVLEALATEAQSQ